MLLLKLFTYFSLFTFNWPGLSGPINYWLLIYTLQKQVNKMQNAFYNYRSLISYCCKKVNMKMTNYPLLRLVIYSQNCLGIDLRISDIRFYLVKSVVRYQIVKFWYHFRDNSESRWPTSMIKLRTVQKSMCSFQIL